MTAGQHFVLFIVCKNRRTHTECVRFLAEIPLFFCVRAISFSISEIFSKIPMTAAVATRKQFRN